MQRVLSFAAIIFLSFSHYTHTYYVRVIILGHEIKPTFGRLRFSNIKSVRPHSDLETQVAPD